ncbi:tape measure protein, partial [Roseospira goensis]
MSGPAHQTVSVSLTAETSDFQQKFQVSQEDLETWRQSAQSAGTEARETARDLDALGDEATETGQRLDDLGDEAKDVGQQVKRAGDAFERATRPLDLLGTRARMSAVGLDVLDDAAARLPGPLATVARAIGPVGLALGAAAVAGGLAAAAIARAGDAYTAATGRLRAATGSLAAATDTYGQLYAAALDTGAALDDTVGAFVRFNIAAQAIGATRDEVAALVETVQKFGIVSGASTAEVSAGAQQLAQALASGRLQGDELRSILENMPLLAKALAENLGVSIGRLREMGAAGELTARRVFDALAEAGDEADRLFEAMPLTIERASATLETAWDRFLVKLDRGLGLSERIAAALAGAAEKLDDLSRTP